MTPFELLEPRSLAEAISLLDPDDARVRPIAGGTALLLMMKSGFYEPRRLVSLRRVDPRFSTIETVPDGALRIGALTPLSAVERSAAVREHAPIIVETLRTLSNVRVRNVATLGGHLAHADPRMDLPPVLVALRAHVVIIGPAGPRTIPIEDLFAGFFRTALGGSELIVDVFVPRPASHQAAYLKCTTRTADDWPALGVAAVLEGDAARVRSGRLVLGAVTQTPQRLPMAEAELVGAALNDRLLDDVGDAAAEEAHVVSDALGSATYKKQLVRVYVKRAIRRAMQR